MDENYLFGLVVLFFFGLVFLKKEKKIDLGGSVDVKPSKYAGTSAETGVSRYLQSQNGGAAETKVTGVAKYLQEKEAIETAQTESLAESSVAKYLASKEESAPISGVSKYMARQAVQAKKIAKENVSGVEKYLNRQR